MKAEVSLGKDIGVDVTAIEKELASLWRQASTSNQEVTRACAWNLVVHCHDDAAFETAKGCLEVAVRHVPARTLILKPRPHATGKEIEAWVTANCQVAPGGGKLLCTEEITIESRGKDGSAHLPSLIRALMVPDVPTALWWVNTPPTDSSALHILLSGVERLIFDTAMLADEGGLTKLAHVGGLLDGLVLTDLNWLRTGSLRSTLASMFDPPVGAAPLGRLKRVHVQCSKRGVHAAKLLLGWLASRLGWGAPERIARGILGWSVPAREVAVRVDIEVVQGPVPRDSGICGISLETSERERFLITDGDGASFQVSTPAVSARTVQVHEQPLPQLLVASLGARGRDRLYPVALHRALELDR